MQLERDQVILLITATRKPAHGHLVATLGLVVIRGGAKEAE